MRLESLKLKNFRGFEEFEVDFDPRFTVLLGGNMAGKSAVLDGVAAALGTLFLSVEQAPQREIRDAEVRQLLSTVRGVPVLQRQFPVEIVACASLGAHGPATPLSWTRTRDGDETIDYENGAIRGDLRSRLRLAGPLELPVLAQYGTRRTWGDTETVEDSQRIGTRFDGYVGCLDVSSSYGVLAGWMRKQTLVQLQRGAGHVQPQLAAVQQAIASCIDDVRRVWFDVEYEEIRLERADGSVLASSMLSEGYRNVVAMVADIAWRAAVLNPQCGEDAGRQTDGVVLIDELDQHLHPAWQRRIVGDLQRTFPKIQFIVTTHSPQIVASVKRSQVRLLENNRLVADELYVEGRDTNGLLEDVFGVPARPEKVQAEIDALYRTIEDEDFAAARRQLADLQDRLGADDAAMIRARWILDTEDADRQQLSNPAP